MNMKRLNNYTVHYLLVVSKIHVRLVKISMLPSVNVIYLRNEHKLIPIFYHKSTDERECTGTGVMKFRI